MSAAMGRCRVCGAARRITTGGTIHLHGPKLSPCPGSGKPPRAGAGQAAFELARTIEELPTRNLGGKAAVLLDDLTDAVDDLFARLGLPPRSDIDG